MGLKAVQQYIFGGVDSRSNPLNMPTTRFLRCRNLVPVSDGHFELRRGYSKQTMSAVVAGAIHSVTGYSVLGGATYGVFCQGTVPKKIDFATNTVSSPTVKGAAIASGSRWSYAAANGRLLAFNGTDRKFFDGTYWRDNGIPALTAADVSGVTVVVGAPNANAVPASSIGGAQPGYIFWVALWNRVTTQVSNAVQIGSRVVPTVASEIDIANLPVPADTEWDILVGRTRDGANIPYAIIDGSGNWVYVAHATTTATISVPDIDGNSELPTRNEPPPAFDKVCQSGNRAYGNLPNSPFIYRSESPDDQTTGAFVGSWEQCWHPDNVETFPTGKAVSCLQEYSQTPWCFSLHHMAILDESNAEPGWQGPWAIGCAGQEAFAETPLGPLWVTGDKQLATMGPNGPIPISDEYERALLAKIGDAYLSTTEVRYVRIPTKGINHLSIKARKSDGTAFRIIHDFNLRDAQSPLGQGYEDIFGGALATDYTTGIVNDQYGQFHLWAGGTTGRLYDLYNGGDDDGTNFTGESIALLNAGPERPKVPCIEWFGDTNVQWAVAQTLNSAEADFKDITSNKESVPGGENDYQYRVSVFSGTDTSLNSEQKYLYVRMQLTSHPGDGTLDLNDPPHMPLEWYGRIYMVAPLVGPERGHIK